MDRDRLPCAIDERLARLRFERAAPRYAGAAKLEAEIGRRMLERLDYVRIAPARVLDAGAGPARESAALLQRYPDARLVAFDFSLAMLRLARHRDGFIARLLRAPRRQAVCGHLARLPFESACFGLVWCNMALHWLSEPLAALREFHRALSPGGLLMFSTLGPDTLKELRGIAGDRVHRFLDMHDIGDRLVGAGFSAPVVDMEILTLTYPDPDALLGELRATGQTAALAGSGRGLGGRGFLQSVRDALSSGSSGERVKATVEVVYGHAWKGTPRRMADGRAKVDLSALRRKVG